MPEKKSSGFLASAIVLCSICLVTALLLLATHKMTAPRIKIQEEKQHEALLFDMLPDAEGFLKIDSASLMEGINSVYKAENDEGYIISVSVNDYQGPLTAMTAIDREGMIADVRITDGEISGEKNDERDGEIYGKSYDAGRTALPGFIDQITVSGSISGAKLRESLGEVEAPAGAHYTKRAVISCVNRAVLQYNEILENPQDYPPERAEDEGEKQQGEKWKGEKQQ